MSSEQEDNPLFRLRNRDVLSSHGTGDVSFDRFGRFSIPTSVQELSMFLPTLKSITLFLWLGECLPDGQKNSFKLIQNMVLAKIYAYFMDSLKLLSGPCKPFDKTNISLIVDDRYKKGKK